MKWQPIETAPIDKPVIVAVKPTGWVGWCMAVAFRDSENELAWTMDDGHSYFPCLRRELANPTHWMPLPMPPQDFSGDIGHE